VLEVSSTWANDRVWFVDDLPENFAVDVVFEPNQDENCWLYFGMGNGSDLYPTYFAHVGKFIGLGKGLLDKKQDLFFATKEIDFMSKGVERKITLIRKDQSLRLLDADGSTLLLYDGQANSEFGELNSLDYLWVWSRIKDGCKITFSRIEVRNYTE